jgi:hypothetical protein
MVRLVFLDSVSKHRCDELIVEGLVSEDVCFVHEWFYFYAVRHVMRSDSLVRKREGSLLQELIDRLSL